MSEEPKKPPMRRKPGAAPRRRRTEDAAVRIPRRKPHSYGQSAEMPEAPDSNPDTVETARKPVAKDEDAPQA